ncbi:MAG TPA: DUF2442 domain-containing protein [Verrucomicrobiae bacterium]
MKAATTKYLEIVRAEYLSGYKIRLAFNDGMVRVMDFEPFLRKAMNPDITKYRQLRNFKKFHLHYGDLMWGDFEMIFPIMDLYEGNILKGGVTTPAHFVLSDAGSAAKNVLGKKTKAAATVSYRKTKTLTRRTK